MRKTQGDAKLRIACFANWFAVRQRPHHWGACALSRGHAFDVFSPPKPLRVLLGLRRPGHAGCSSRVVAARRPFRTILPLCSEATKQRLIRAATLSLQRMVFSAAQQYDVLLFCSPLVGLLPVPAARATLVYDCMDEWSGFRGAPPDVSLWESSLARRATVVVAVTPELVEKLRNVTGGKEVHLLPNACEYERFSQAAVRRGVDGAGPIIGYVGSVASWFDWATVIRLAAELPEATIRIVGPAQGLPVSLPPNIEIVGQIPYENVPRSVAEFDVGIIPFRQDDKLNAGISPIKLYEYLATGIPVVGTALPEVSCLAGEGVVYEARTTDEFVSACRRALCEGADQERAEARRVCARANSWTARWATLEASIQHSLSEKS